MHNIQRDFLGRAPGDQESADRGGDPMRWTSNWSVPERPKATNTYKKNNTLALMLKKMRHNREHGIPVVNNSYNELKFIVSMTLLWIVRAPEQKYRSLGSSLQGCCAAHSAILGAQQQVQGTHAFLLLCLIGASTPSETTTTNVEEETCLVSWVQSSERVLGCCVDQPVGKP